jgi:putative FmdB family regulatory protein
MPIYELQCDECGNAEEVICAFEERDGRTCECGGNLHNVFTGQVAFVGAIWDKKITAFEKQIGQTFETNEQERRYFKENPGWVPVSKDDSLMQRRRDFHLNGADRTARALGYKDHEEKSRHAKEKRAKVKAK